jgi:putative sigma-54 modulation protein
MIQKLEINGVHTTVGNDLKKYINKKLGRLDRYIPKNAREAAHVEVLIKESKLKERRQHTCEVVFYLPKGKPITVKETTLNPFAAVDIVETKCKNLLKKYKDQHGNQSLHRRVLRRVLRSRPPTPFGT